MCGFQLIEIVQGYRQSVAVLTVVRLKFHGFGQAEQGVFRLPVVKQPNAKRMLQICRLGMGFELSGQQLTCGVGLAAFIQQLYLSHHGLEILRVQCRDFFQCSPGLIQLTFMQIKPGELALGLRVVGTGFEFAFEFVDDLLQRPEVKALLIRRQAQQCIGGGKTYALLRIIEQRAKQ